jgi:hypothetical protein
MPQENWAVILCRFQDDTDPNPSKIKYERFFTTLGKGSLNAVEYFQDMSHGRADSSGSKVFGWINLPLNKADYVHPAAAGVGQLDRDNVVDYCKNAAISQGVELTEFSRVGILLNGIDELFGYDGYFVCGSINFRGSGIQHEIGHGYGLQHARRFGSETDYTDPYDIMSVFSTPYMTTHPEWEIVGPGLNAWNMRSLNWLDESRVWTNFRKSYSKTVELRPLYQPGLPGNLAVQVGRYLIEFRLKTKWDLRIKSSSVLIHTFTNTHSYIYPPTNRRAEIAGRLGMIKGDVFEHKLDLLEPDFAARVEILSIDNRSKTAIIQLDVVNQDVLFARNSSRQTLHWWQAWVNPLHDPDPPGEPGIINPSPFPDLNPQPPTIPMPPRPGGILGPRGGGNR